MATGFHGQAVRAALAGMLLVLAGCGGHEAAVAPGQLVGSPTLTQSLTPAQFQTGYAGLLAVAGAPRCTVQFHSYTFTTRGAVGEQALSTAAVMTPSGSDPACTGPRPVLLYAHGTWLDKNLHMAQPSHSEAALVAATFAGQGYIVIAPNYAGYAGSTLPYHPYLIAHQQSAEMIDAWQAIKSAWPGGVAANNKLFISGYSQGGHVAMATQRAMQQAGVNVTATAPMSGPYALGRFADAIFGGAVSAGATLFAPLLITAVQKTDGTLYSHPGELYESAYASGIEELLPSTTDVNVLIANGKLPAAHLFAGDSQPQLNGGFGFGAGHLIKTSYRNAVLADLQNNPQTPAHPLRVAAYRNDLLLQNWAPTQPTLLCGGNADPVVYFSVNTTAAQTRFGQQGAGAWVTVLDVDSAPAGPSDPFTALKIGFLQAKTQAGGNALAMYHGTLVPPFCQAAARNFFGAF